MKQQDQNLKDLNKTFIEKMKLFQKFFKKQDILIDELNENEVEAELEILNDRLSKRENDLDQALRELEFYRKEANKANEIYASTLLIQSQL